MDKIKQPKSINEIKELIRTIADVKAGAKAMRSDYSKNPYELFSEIDFYELADDLMKCHLQGCQNSRLDERERIVRNLIKVIKK